MSATNRRQFLSRSAATAAAATFAAHHFSAARTEAAAKLEHRKTKFAVNLEMIKFGTSPFLDRIDKVAEYGFPAFEFWPTKGKDVAAIAKKAKALNLSVAQFTAAGWGVRPIDAKNHPRFVAAVKDACAAAHQLDCKLLTVVSGQSIKGIPRETQMRNLIEGLKQAGEVVAKEDITLILEPLNVLVDHKGHFLSTTDDTLHVMTSVDNPHVKINFDIYHQQITEGNLCNNIQRAYEHIGYFQVADVPGRHEPGTGEIRYPHVLEFIHNLGYRGFVGMEFSPKTNADAALKATIDNDFS